MAKIYKTNGEITEVEPKNGTDFTLQELQDIVGGTIDMQATSDGTEMVVFNEEGKLKHLPCNGKATAIYNQRVYKYDYLVGDVLMCKNEQVR